jgi:molecular chaperone GrpE
MTGKEKSEELKHNAAGKKKVVQKHTDKAVQVGEDQVEEKLREELSAFEEKSREMQEELKASELKSQDMHDKYLRLSAEFDNYRKRTLKEKTELIKTASEDLIRKIIPFVDDIERGLNAVNTAQDMEAVKLGMNLIYGRFKDFLQLNGVKEIEALNQEFNTDMHEAITKIPVTEEELKGKVVEVVEKGYLLHDKVIRYPKVVVGE